MQPTVKSSRHDECSSVRLPPASLLSSASQEGGTAADDGVDDDDKSVDVSAACGARAARLQSWRPMDVTGTSSGDVRAHGVDSI